MLTCQNFVADFHDQGVALVVEPAGGVIGIRRRLFQNRIAVIISRGIRSAPMLKCSSER